MTGALCAPARLKTAPIYFFKCPLAQTVWNEAALEGIDVTAGDAFWQSICQGPFRRETVADHLRHIMGNMAPPERDYI